MACSIIAGDKFSENMNLGSMMPLGEMADQGKLTNPKRECGAPFKTIICVGFATQAQKDDWLDSIRAEVDAEVDVLEHGGGEKLLVDLINQINKLKCDLLAAERKIVELVADTKQQPVNVGESGENLLHHHPEHLQTEGDLNKVSNAVAADLMLVEAKKRNSLHDQDNIEDCKTVNYNVEKTTYGRKYTCQDVTIEVAEEGYHFPLFSVSKKGRNGVQFLNIVELCEPEEYPMRTKEPVQRHIPPVLAKRILDDEGYDVRVLDFDTFDVLKRGVAIMECVPLLEIRPQRLPSDVVRKAWGSSPKADYEEFFKAESRAMKKCYRHGMFLGKPVSHGTSLNHNKVVQALARFAVYQHNKTESKNLELKSIWDLVFPFNKLGIKFNFILLVGSNSSDDGLPYTATVIWTPARVPHLQGFIPYNGPRPGTPKFKPDSDSDSGSDSGSDSDSDSESDSDEEYSVQHKRAQIPEGESSSENTDDEEPQRKKMKLW